MADQKQEKVNVDKEVPDNANDISRGNDGQLSNGQCRLSIPRMNLTSRTVRPQSRKTCPDTKSKESVTKETENEHEATRSITGEKDIVCAGFLLSVMPLYPFLLEVDGDSDESATAEEDNAEQSSDP